MFKRENIPEGGIMQVTGETMIFKNDKGYSTTISKKNEDGKHFCKFQRKRRNRK